MKGEREETLRKAHGAKESQINPITPLTTIQK